MLRACSHLRSSSDQSLMEAALGARVVRLQVFSWSCPFLLFSPFSSSWEKCHTTTATSIAEKTQAAFSTIKSICFHWLTDVHARAVTR